LSKESLTGRRFFAGRAHQWTRGGWPVWLILPWGGWEKVEHHSLRHLVWVLGGALLGVCGGNLCGWFLCATPGELLLVWLAGVCAGGWVGEWWRGRSEEHTSELESRFDLVCCLLLV